MEAGLVAADALGELEAGLARDVVDIRASAHPLVDDGGVRVRVEGFALAGLGDEDDGYGAVRVLQDFIDELVDQFSGAQMDGYLGEMNAQVRWTFVRLESADEALACGLGARLVGRAPVGMLVGLEPDGDALGIPHVFDFESMIGSPVERQVDAETGEGCGRVKADDAAER